MNNTSNSLATKGKFVTVSVNNSRVNRQINGKISRETKNYLTIREASSKKNFRFNKSSVVGIKGV